MIQYSTVQYSTVQYSTVQYSTVQYSPINFYSAGIVGVANFKGASSQKAYNKIENIMFIALLYSSG